MAATVTERAVCVAAGAALVVAIHALYSLQQRRSGLKTAPSSASQACSSSIQIAPQQVPEELELELYSRNVGFFGEAGFAQIREAFVIVVGLGGVGSHAAHMLARSGVRRLRLIDFDQVTLSSLNRHAVATWADVGTSKAQALKDRLRAIVPGVDIDARAQMFRAEDAEELLSGAPAYVLDCIDDVTTKCELLAHCAKAQLPVMSSMGAALKCDPSRLHIGTLYDATRDPLAAKIKWRLKKFKVDPELVNCVFLAASPVGTLMPLTDEQVDAPNEFGTMENFRLRTLPVLGTIPAVFGQAMATWVLCELGGKPFAPAPMVSMGRALKNRLLQRLKSRELRDHSNEAVLMDMEDIAFCVEQWRGRCPATNLRMIGHEQLELMRWDPTKPLAPNNVVLLAASFIKQLDERGRDAVVTPELAARIQATLQLQGTDW